MMSLMAISFIIACITPETTIHNCWHWFKELKQPCIISHIHILMVSSAEAASLAKKGVCVLNEVYVEN